MNVAGRFTFVASVLIGLAACGGTVELGLDRGADAAVVGPTDTGVIVTPDAGACRPRVRPAVGAAWPYPMTAAAYQTHFLNVVPGTAGCALAGCHGATSPPYIADAAALATPANVTRAINELWLRARPPAGGGIALLRTKHDAAGLALPPAYTPQQITAIQTFLDRAYDCAWRTAPAPGPGECPAPDTAYCER